MNINNYFIERINQYQKSTIQRLTRTNPFRSLVDMSPFPLEDGRTPIVRTYTHELPTAYPGSMAQIGVSSGSGQVACAPSAVTIARGEIQRTFTLFGASFRTATVCLSDLKRAHQAAEAVGAFEKSLKEYLTVWWSDFYRLQNIAMVDYKASTTSTTFLSTSASSAVDHTGVSGIPTQNLNWAHLDQVYADLVRRGVAEEYAVGQTSSGAPVIPLILGMGYKQALFRDDSDKREQIKFYDSSLNLKAMGFDGAINGFLPIVDVFPIRYGNATPIAAAAGLTVANMIYPTSNTSATVGQKNVPNANYLSVARGGLAQFEVVTILPKNVYSTHYESSEPSSFAGSSFSAGMNYVGEFKWINNATFEGDNDRGNLGYYLADVRVASKPLNPDLGISIVTKAFNL
jgi:hypothetical protein